MTAQARVLFIHSSNDMFGADRILLQVAEAATLAGFTCEVWLPADVAPAADALDSEVRKRGYTLRTLPLPILRRRDLRPVRLPGLLWRCIRTWARLVVSRPAVVYCSTSAALLAAPLARAAGVGIVVLHNQEIWSRKEARLLGLLARSCTNAIAISRPAQQSLSGPIVGRSVVIENGVPDRPAPLPITGAVNPLGFLIASRWNSWKGHATLLAAWDSLEPAPGILTIAGSPPEVGIAVDVRAMVDDLRHPESVVIVGQVADITPYVDACDYVLMPSDNPEPFGLVAVEAFSRCRPVIGSDGGGLAEVITDGEDGYLYPLRDARALAAVLARSSRDEARKLGETARGRYLANYSAERFRADFLGFWQDVAARQRRI